jgi:hypothetical protein
VGGRAGGRGFALLGRANQPCSRLKVPKCAALPHQPTRCPISPPGRPSPCVSHLPCSAALPWPAAASRAAHLRGTGLRAAGPEAQDAGLSRAVQRSTAAQQSRPAQVTARPHSPCRFGSSNAAPNVAPPARKPFFGTFVPPCHPSQCRMNQLPSSPYGSAPPFPPGSS